MPRRKQMHSSVPDDTKDPAQAKGESVEVPMDSQTMSEIGGDGDSVNDNDDLDVDSDGLVCEVPATRNIEMGSIEEILEGDDAVLGYVIKEPYQIPGLTPREGNQSLKVTVKILNKSHFDIVDSEEMLTEECLCRIISRCLQNFPKI